MNTTLSGDIEPPRLQYLANCTRLICLSVLRQPLSPDPEFRRGTRYDVLTARPLLTSSFAIAENVVQKDEPAVKTALILNFITPIAIAPPFVVNCLFHSLFRGCSLALHSLGHWTLVPDLYPRFRSKSGIRDKILCSLFHCIFFEQ